MTLNFIFVQTEFMVHLDGAATKDDARVIFIGATNRPQVSAILNYSQK